MALPVVTTGGGRSAAAAGRRKLTLDRASFMLVFVGLPVALFGVFVVYPIGQAVYSSLTQWGGFSPNKTFIGIQNYTKLWHDDTFRQAVVNCIKLGIVVPLVTIILALAVASLVTVGGSSRGNVRGIRGASFYRVISFFPYCVPAIVVAMIWNAVYTPNSGVLDGVLDAIGLHGMKSYSWLGGSEVAIWASMFVIIWSFVGFYSVLFVASIKSVPSEIYEAVRLDGAGRFRTAISVTIPLIRDNIQTAYIYLGITALDSFVYMQALNPAGTNGSTLTMSQDLFVTAFTKTQFGYASAMGVTLAVITLLFATLVFLVNRWTGGRETPVRTRRRRRGSAEPIEPAALTTVGAGAS